MIVNINALGQVGIISDHQPTSLPPNAFSDAQNVRFREGQAMRVRGYTEMQAMDGQGVYILPYEYAGAAYWMLATSRRLYSWDGTTLAEITRSSGVYGGDPADIWTGGVYNGQAIFNNGRDIPQVWAPDLGLAIDMPDWPSNWRAKTVRPYRNFLIALNMTEDGVNYPTRFRWSDVADPGTVPTSWIPAATNQAGDDVIEETQGEIIDAEALRNDLIIYKSDSAYFMSFVGGQFVMANRPALKTRGLLAQRCAKEFEIGRHFVADRGDIYVHDGNRSESILKGRAYEKFFPSIDQDRYGTSYVTKNFIDEEVWFCFPESGSSFPTLAAIWNWKENTWGVRDLPDASHTAFGTYPATVDEYNPTTRSLISLGINKTAQYPETTLYPEATLYPDDGDSSIYAMEVDGEYQANGSDMTCTVVRTGMKPEPTDGVWLCRAAFPHCEGGAIKVRVGSQDSPNQTPTWSAQKTYTPEGTNDKLNFRVTGRYLAYEIEFPAAAEGNVASIDFDIVQVGTR